MNKIATKLRTQADGMTKQIERKLHPAIAQQNPTPRRARIAAGMFENGVRLQKVQTILNKLADAHECRRVPAILHKVSTKTDVTNLLFYSRKYDDAWFDRTFELGVNTQRMYEWMQLEVAAMIDDTQYNAQRRKIELYNKAHELIGQVPGYFPTPMKIVKRMIEYAGDIDDDAFDPEAGGGAILDGVNQYAPGVKTHGFEINWNLWELCKEKGHDVYQGDIFNAPVTRQYKTILMNPPFENDGAADHVSYVYENWLAPSGVLVSITDSGAFSRSTKKAQAFQELVKANGKWEALPDGSFKASKTNVNTCIVCLTK